MYISFVPTNILKIQTFSWIQKFTSERLLEWFTQKFVLLLFHEWGPLSLIYNPALVSKSLTWLCAGWIWRLMAVSWTGWALAWARPVYEPCWLSAWWLTVEWKMVACWFWANPWLWCAGLGKTGMIPATDEVWVELWMASEAVCWWGWTEAVCSNWGWVLEVGGAWGWMTNCCGCCLIRACGWIWAYAGRRNHRQTFTITYTYCFTWLHIKLTVPNLNDSKVYMEFHTFRQFFFLKMAKVRS